MGVNEKVQEHIRDYESKYPYKWWKKESKIKVKMTAMMKFVKGEQKRG